MREEAGRCVGAQLGCHMDAAPKTRAPPKPRAMTLHISPPPPPPPPPPPTPPPPFLLDDLHCRLGMSRSRCPRRRRRELSWRASWLLRSAVCLRVRVLPAFKGSVGCWGPLPGTRRRGRVVVCVTLVSLSLLRGRAVGWGVSLCVSLSTSCRAVVWCVTLCVSLYFVAGHQGHPEWCRRYYSAG